MKTLLKKINGTDDVAAARYLENTVRVLEYLKLMVHERGKRAVERHWMFRSAGNRSQRRNPKGSRYYSYLGLRYTEVKNQLYFRWVRFRFWTTSSGGEKKKEVRGRAISPTDGQGYDLRKLKQGTASWERKGITHTEKYLKEIRKVQVVLKEMRANTLRLANALADLERADHTHYENIREEILAMGYTMEEYERIEHAHLSVMTRAQTEGADVLPLSRSRMYDPEKGIPAIEVVDTRKVPADGFIEEENAIGDEELLGMNKIQEESVEITPEEGGGGYDLEDDAGLPDPDFFRRLHEREETN